MKNCAYLSKRFFVQTFLHLSELQRLAFPDPLVALEASLEIGSAPSLLNKAIARPYLRLPKRPRKHGGPADRVPFLSEVIHQSMI